MTVDGAFRMLAVNGTEIVQTAQTDHDTWPASSAALGRTLIGTLLLSSALLKDEEKLTVRILGDGPVGAIVADGNADGTVKGYISQPHVNLPLNPVGKIDVRQAVGTSGMVNVTKDLGLKQPFTGQVPITSGEIAEDLTYYLAKSEQIPSAMGLSVFVNQDNSIGVAGGFLIQTLPDATDEQLTNLEKNLKALPLVSDLLRDGKTPEMILEEIFADEEIKFLDKMPVAFQCDCSKDRFAKAIAALSKNDLNEMINQDHGAEAVCKFCGKKYQFTEDELKELAAQSN